ncbi:hypothetical protein GOP47_0024678 [Adiantum capillus-veneris]|uniref:DNA-directed DNA polymerase n=1 Tax=Adiantum capillus-veneris TaxID=13818 RepID=A0A9D4U3C3_ADICA|nr:hypothetical protein GOP47_0024678 [Adiantum capillus-veneris]
MGVFKVGMSQQGATNKPQHYKLPTHLVSLLVDLLDCKKIMLEAGQPGELPLMQELSSLRRLRSLRDPNMESNAGRGSSAARTPSWKSPIFKTKDVRKSPVFRTKEVRHDQFNGSRSRDTRSSKSPAFHVKPPLRRAGLSQNVVASPVSDPMHAFESERAWDLGMTAESPLYGVHIKRRPSLEAHRVEVFRQHKSSRNHNDDGFSLDGWRDPSWASDMEASHATSYSMQHPRSMPKHHRSGIRAPSAGVRGLTRDSFGSQKQNLLDRMHGSQRMFELYQPRTMPSSLQQQTQVLSPLVLNPHEDTQHHGKSFSLEGNHNQSSRVATRGFRSDMPLSESPQYSKTATKKGQRVPVKGTWKPKHSAASSSSTSRRTASQSSLSGAWEATSNQLEDELDVCELPTNRCGIPCYWSKSQRKGKGFLDMAEKSFACGLYSRSPRRMTHSGSQNYNSQFQGGYPGHEPVPPLDLEALPLLSDPSACSEDLLGMSDSDKLSSVLNGELGIHGGGVGDARSEGTASESKELAVYRKRPRSLSQKYRPKVFEELVGQSLAAQALSNAVQKRKIAPVYLFQGPRGTGKTSAARIFAAALNCNSPEHLKPCGCCKECLAFASGKSIDIREVDAASNNAVEKVKGLLQTAFLAPSFSQYKIFIIDECHMLTSEAWNVLLKLLEEPPRNVVFILTTTDPDKLPTMAVSRCQKFPFPKIKDAEIVERLQALVKLENLNVEPGALELVATRADGSLRDAEIILDQLSLLGQRITISTVHELFGSVSDEKLLGLLDFALRSDTVNTVQRARELIDSGVEPLDLMAQLATLITDILAGSSDLIAKCHDGGFFSNQALSEEELERLRFALQVLSDSEKQLRAASTDRTTWLTAALLQLGPARVCAIALSTSSASAAASPVVKAVSNGSRQALKVVNGRNTHSNMEKGSLQKKVHSLTAMRNKNTSLRSGFEVQVHPEETSKVSSAASTEPSNEKLQADSALSGRRATLVGPGNLEDIWWTILERCKSPAIRQLLRNHGKLLAVSISADSAVVFIEFDTVESKSRSERCKKNIINLFQEVLGLSLEVKIALASNAKAATSVGARVQAIVDQQAMHSQTELRQSPTKALPQHEHKLGSLHYWRSHSQTASPHLERANSIRSFPAILTISKSNRVADSEVAMRSLNGTPHFGNAGKFVRRAEIAIFEGTRLAGSWNSKSRIISSLQKAQSGEEIQEIVLDNGRDSAEPVKAGSKAMPENVFSYDVEEENLRLESQSKYGGLLCWRNPQVDDEKVSKIHQKGGCAILMRLVPCANSERR